MAFDRDPKPKHAGGYPPEHAGLCEQTLVTLLRSLGPWKAGIYLAGGLVPRYLVGYPPRAEGPPPHVGTTDVDLVLSLEILAAVGAYETLEKNLKNLASCAAQTTRISGRTSPGSDPWETVAPWWWTFFAIRRLLEILAWSEFPAKSSFRRFR